MSDGGKGSAPRPLAVSYDEYTAKWNAIFRNEGVSKSQAKRLAVQRENNTGTDKNEYYDVLSTEDCLDPVTRDDAAAEDEAFKYVEEHQKYKV